MLKYFTDEEMISELTAKMLIEVEAVKFNIKVPFKFTSGWASPVYIDCRKLISYPKVGHMPPMEIPEKLAYDIKSFLGK